MKLQTEMIRGSKGDYRNKASAIKEGRAIQADARKVSQSRVLDAKVVQGHLKARLHRERAARMATPQ